MILRKEEQELCRKHKSRIQYWCKTCRQAICSQCAMFEPEHKGHEFDKLSNIVSKWQEQHRANLNTLTKRRRTLAKVLQSVEESSLWLNQLREDKNFELQRFASGIVERIQATSKQLSESYQGQEKRLGDELSSLRTTYDNFNNRILYTSKQKLVRQFQDIITEVTNYNKEYQAEKSTVRPAKITSQLVPTYNQKTFKIHKYTVARKSKQPLFTESFHCQNLQWRLKIYPNGSDSSEDTYISIFVELFNVHGQFDQDSCVGKYRYKVDILNQVNKNKKISREFESQFMLNECWGYNTYAKISQLYDQGYVHPQEDYLEIILNLKCSTYFYKVMEAQRIVDQKINKIKENEKKIQKLKEAISQEPKNNSPLLIGLDEICEVPSALGGESPRIDDSEIFSPVLQQNILQRKPVF